MVEVFKRISSSFQLSKALIWFKLFSCLSSICDKWAQSLRTFKSKSDCSVGVRKYLAAVTIYGVGWHWVHQPFSLDGFSVWHSANEMNFTKPTIVAITRELKILLLLEPFSDENSSRIIINRLWPFCGIFVVKIEVLLSLQQLLLIQIFFGASL